MYATLMETQVKRVEIVVKFWNQVKTVLEPALHDRYVNNEMLAVIMTQ